MKRWLFLFLSCTFFWASWAQYTPPVSQESPADTTKVFEETTLSYEACVSRALGALMNTDSLAVAQRYLETALRKSPNSPSNHVVHELLGRIFLQRNQPKDALRAYNESLRLKPIYLPALELRAQLYAAQKDFDAAYADYSAILSEVAPSETEYLRKILLARADISFKQEKMERAASDLERVLRTAPKDIQANLLLAYVHQKMGREEEAQMRVNVMVETYPQNATCLMTRAHFSFLRKEYDEAIDDYNAALTLEPQNGTLFAQRAAVLERLGRIRAARLDREQARKLGCSEEEIEYYTAK